MARDGQKVYFVSGNSEWIGVINTLTNQVVGKISLKSGYLPWKPTVSCK